MQITIYLPLELFSITNQHNNYKYTKLVIQSVLLSYIVLS